MKNLGIILLLILVSSGVFLNTLQHDFIWDDMRFILDHPFIKDFANIKHIFSLNYFLDSEAMLARGMYNVGRPVWAVSAMIDYKIWQDNPLGHHLTNVILHTLCVLLLFALLNLIFKNRRLAFISGLIFAMHPIHAETINVVTFRTDMLALLFMILSFIVFIKALDVSLPKAAVSIIFSFALYGIAIFAKGMAVTLPILLGLYLYLLVPKERLIRNKKPLIFYFSAVAVIVTVFLFIRRTHFFYGNVDIALALAEKNLLYRLGVMCLVFLRYVRLLVLPVGLCADYSFRLPASTFSLNAITAAAILAGIIGYALLLRRKQAAVSFAILWFFITLLPVSNIIPIVNIIAERYLYIPSVGFAIFLGALFTKWQDLASTGGRKKAVSWLLIAVLCLYTAQTVRRNQDWKDDLTIWTKTVKQSPDNFRVRNNLGKAYRVAGRFHDAVLEFKKAIEISPDNSISHANLAICYENLGRPEEAKAEYRKALEIKPMQPHAVERLWILHTGLGNDYLKEGRLDEAMEEYLASIRLKPDVAQVYYNMGNIFLAKDMLREAKDMYLKATHIDKYYGEAYSNLGVVFAREGKIPAAIEQWNRALRFHPGLKSAQENLDRLKEDN